MSSTAAYSLDAKKLEDAVGILDSELEALNSCIRVQRSANASWLMTVSYVFLVAFAVIMMLSNHGSIPPAL
jgi:hypothetical protein